MELNAGTVLRVAARVKGMSNVDLAKESGVSRQNIDLLFKGKTQPRVDTLISLAKPLGLTAAEVLDICSDATNRKN